MFLGMPYDVMAWSMICESIRNQRTWGNFIAAGLSGYHCHSIRLVSFALGSSKLVWKWMWLELHMRENFGRERHIQFIYKQNLERCCRRIWLAFWASPGVLGKGNLWRARVHETRPYLRRPFRSYATGVSQGEMLGPLHCRILICMCVRLR